MAHMQKFKGSSAAHILGHCEREKGKEGYLKYHNGSYIDESRTQYNQSFPAEGTGKQRLEQRLAEVAPKRRKDAVTMIDWVVTLPAQLSDSSGKAISRFFSTTLHFLSDRYGAKNLVGAYLHVDETTPHLHYCFVPVVTDPDGTERLCAKQLMSKKELQSFHRDLDRELESIFGIPGLALTGITKEQGGNKSVSELKKLSEKAELLENEKNRLEAKIDAFCDDLFDEVDDDVVIELFKRLPYKKQFQAVLEAEFPDIQYRPQVIDQVFEEYMESFEPSYLRSDVIKSIEQASGVEYEKGHLLYEDDDWEL